MSKRVSEVSRRFVPPKRGSSWVVPPERGASSLSTRLGPNIAVAAVAGSSGVTNETALKGVSTTARVHVRQPKETSSGRKLLLSVARLAPQASRLARLESFFTTSNLAHSETVGKLRRHVVAERPSKDIDPPHKDPRCDNVARTISRENEKPDDFAENHNTARGEAVLRNRDAAVNRVYPSSKITMDVSRSVTREFTRANRHMVLNTTEDDVATKLSGSDAIMDVLASNPATQDTTSKVEGNDTSPAQDVSKSNMRYISNSEDPIRLEHDAETHTVTWIKQSAHWIGPEVAPPSTKSVGSHRSATVARIPVNKWAAGRAIETSRDTIQKLQNPRIRNVVGQNATAKTMRIQNVVAQVESSTRQQLVVKNNSSNKVSDNQRDWESVRIKKVDPAVEPPQGTELKTATEIASNSKPDATSKRFIIGEEVHDKAYRAEMETLSRQVKKTVVVQPSNWRVSRLNIPDAIKNVQYRDKTMNAINIETGEWSQREHKNWSRPDAISSTHTNPKQSSLKNNEFLIENALQTRDVIQCFVIIHRDTKLFKRLRVRQFDQQIAKLLRDHIMPIRKLTRSEAVAVTYGLANLNLFDACSKRFLQSLVVRTDSSHLRVVDVWRYLSALTRLQNTKTVWAQTAFRQFVLDETGALTHSLGQLSASERYNLLPDILASYGKMKLARHQQGIQFFVEAENAIMKDIENASGFHSFSAAKLGAILWSYAVSDLSNVGNKLFRRTVFDLLSANSKDTGRIFDARFVGKHGTQHVSDTLLENPNVLSRVSWALASKSDVGTLRNDYFQKFLLRKSDKITTQALPLLMSKSLSDFCNLAWAMSRFSEQAADNLSDVTNEMDPSSSASTSDTMGTQSTLNTPDLERRKLQLFGGIVNEFYNSVVRIEGQHHEEARRNPRRAVNMVWSLVNAKVVKNLDQTQIKYLYSFALRTIAEEIERYQRDEHSRSSREHSLWISTLCWSFADPKTIDGEDFLDELVKGYLFKESVLSTMTPSEFMSVLWALAKTENFDPLSKLFQIMLSSPRWMSTKTSGEKSTNPDPVGDQGIALSSADLARLSWVCGRLKHVTQPNQLFVEYVIERILNHETGFSNYDRAKILASFGSLCSDEGVLIGSLAKKLRPQIKQVFERLGRQIIHEAVAARMQEKRALAMATASSTTKPAPSPLSLASSAAIQILWSYAKADVLEDSLFQILAKSARPRDMQECVMIMSSLSSLSWYDLQLMTEVENRMHRISEGLTHGMRDQRMGATSPFSLEEMSSIMLAYARLFGNLAEGAMNTSLLPMYLQELDRITHASKKMPNSSGTSSMICSSPNAANANSTRDLLHDKQRLAKMVPEDHEVSTSQERLNTIYSLCLIGGNSLQYARSLLQDFLPSYSWMAYDRAVHHRQLYRIHVALTLDKIVTKNSDTNPDNSHSDANPDGRQPASDPNDDQLLPPEVVDFLVTAYRRFNSKELAGHSGVFHNEVCRTLKQLRISFDSEWEEPKSLFMVDLYIPDRNLLVEVDGYHHFLRSGANHESGSIDALFSAENAGGNNRSAINAVDRVENSDENTSSSASWITNIPKKQMNGATAFKHRILRGLGYKVVSIGAHEWYKCRSPTDKQRLLTEVLSSVS